MKGKGMPKINFGRTVQGSTFWVEKPPNSSYKRAMSVVSCLLSVVKDLNICKI